MTKDEILSSEEILLKASDISKVMRLNPQTIRLQAKRGKLPFETLVMGERVYIVRSSFVKWAWGDTA